MSEQDISDIGHSYDPKWINRAYLPLRIGLKRNFGEVYQEGKIEKGSNIFVMHHKSYWDPLILAFAYYTEDSGNLLEDNERDVPGISYQDSSDKNNEGESKGLKFAAGDDVVGNGLSKNLLNKLGCFEVKRGNGKENGLGLELIKYMGDQLEDYGVLIFPEIHSNGEEDRTGRSLNGKVGEFSPLYTLAAKGNDDVQIVPADITYRELPEDYALSNEIKKRSERNLGRIGSFLEGKKEKWRAFFSKKNPAYLTIGDPLEYNGENRELNKEVQERVLDLIKPTPANLVAGAMSNLEVQFFDSELKEEVETLYNSLREKEVDTSILESMDSLNEVIEEGKEILSAGSKERFDGSLIEFYENQISHLLE